MIFFSFLITRFLIVPDTGFFTQLIQGWRYKEHILCTLDRGPYVSRCFPNRLWTLIMNRWLFKTWCFCRFLVIWLLNIVCLAPGSGFIMQFSDHYFNISKRGFVKLFLLWICQRIISQHVSRLFYFDYIILLHYVDTLKPYHTIIKVSLSDTVILFD